MTNFDVMKRNDDEAQRSIELENLQFFNELNDLIRDERFLIDVANACDSSYKESAKEILIERGEDVQPWLEEDLFTPDEEALLINKTDRTTLEYQKAQEKQAINAAGMYAFQDAMNLLAENGKSVSDIMERLNSDKLTSSEVTVFSLFAHTAWAAGQPFRDREDRDVMMPWALLSNAEKEKDMVQVKAVAGVLNKYLNK